jgi:hypothetical protein
VASVPFHALGLPRNAHVVSGHSGLRGDFNGKLQIAAGVPGPDLLTAIDLDTCELIANQASYVGQNIALIAIPIQAGFRHEEVYRALGPRAFGFDFDYQPIQRLRCSRP